MSRSEGYAGPKKQIVGVLGGMGPLATADFMSKLIARTPVQRESDHLPIAVWSNPEIPNRTQFLLGYGPSPLPAMRDGVARLVGMGVDAIAIPCNTAHAFLPELGERSGTYFFDMISIALDQVARESRAVRTVGVLSTAGTRLARLYSSACDARGLKCVELSDQLQRTLVEPAIAQVKIGLDLQKAGRLIGQAAKELAHLGAEVVIAGCTEIPLVATQAAEVLPVVDATDCLAIAVIDRVLDQSNGGPARSR